MATTALRQRRYIVPAKGRRKSIVTTIFNYLKLRLRRHCVRPFRSVFDEWNSRGLTPKYAHKRFLHSTSLSHTSRRQQSSSVGSSPPVENCSTFTGPPIPSMIEFYVYSEILRCSIRERMDLAIKTLWRGKRIVTRQQRKLWSNQRLVCRFRWTDKE